tara:strand:+ start:170 stop:460 length:291 start_codon:yes stop_codon:yes gene_type:complete
MKFKSYFLSFLGFIFLNQILTIKSSPQLNTNSIIKIFCIENVKSEIRKANLIYTETFGNNVCDCYIKNINNNIEHDKSIFKCKEYANKQLDSHLKE